MIFSFGKIKLNGIEKKLIEKIKPYYANDYSGHDLDHAIRTMAIGKYIARHEGGDVLVVAIACLVHDIFRKEESYSNLPHFAQQNLQKLKKILYSLTLPSQKLNRILVCVANHENYGDKENDFDLETKIVQDADRIDAIGAIGIARAFMFGGIYRIPIGEPKDSDKSFSPEKRNATIFAHFNDKLLKINDGLHTETGKKIAEERHSFLVQYLQQSNKELNQIKRWCE